MQVHDSILEAIGRTPLVRLGRLSAGLPTPVIAKLEYFNPGGSVKDRIGLAMIRAAEKEGRLKPGGTIIECTSGNTGMGLALATCLLGYRLVITIPDKMSREKIDALRAFGAEVIVCPTAVAPEDPESYYSVARRLEREIPGAAFMNQYDNPANPQAHFETTGPELWEQTEGRITHFVVGCGTGGTATGVGRYLKQRNPRVRIIGVDPIGSLFYDAFHSGVVDPAKAKVYKIEGIGEDFLPSTMDLSVLDDMIQVSDAESYRMARRLVDEEGVFSGSSAGSAVVGALQVAAGARPDDVVVTLIPDSGSRYLSKLFNDDWMREHQLGPQPGALSVREVLARKATRYRRLIATSPEASAFEAVRLIKDHQISVLPVFDDGRVVGSLEEGQAIDLFMHYTDPAQVAVRQVMTAPLPQVEADSSLDDVHEYLTGRNQAVLVHFDDGRYDILTKYDLIQVLT